VGGTPPYVLSVTVTGPDGVAVVKGAESLEGAESFELAAPNGGSAAVSVEVVDAAGASASGTAHVALGP